MIVRNLENIAAYDIVASDNLNNRGISVMLRVKNEENTIQASILSIIDFVDEVFVFDNRSTDNTVEIVDELALRYPNRIRLKSYPFDVSLCGREFANTPPESIRSLAYYYNWCKSWCRFSYLIKWDADMIIPENKRTRWKTIRERVLNSDNLVHQLIGRLVVLDTARIFRDSELNIQEPRIYPNTSDYYYVRSDNCYTERISFRGAIFESCKAELNMTYSEEMDFFEIKDMNQNEFEHFGKDEVHLEEKQTRESNFLRAIQNNEKSYRQIIGDRFLDLIEI